MGNKKTVVLWCLPPKIVPVYFPEKKKEVSKFPAMHKTGLKTSETKKSLKFVEEGETQKTRFKLSSATISNESESWFVLAHYKNINTKVKRVSLLFGAAATYSWMIELVPGKAL